MSDQGKPSTVPAPLRALGVVVFVAAGLFCIPVGIYGAVTYESPFSYFFLVFGGVCAIYNGVRIARGLQRERSSRT